MLLSGGGPCALMPSPVRGAQQGQEAVLSVQSLVGEEMLVLEHRGQGGKCSTRRVSLGQQNSQMGSPTQLHQGLRLQEA